MAFSFPWASSAGTDFNYDFHTTHTTEQQRSGTGELNFRPVGPQPEPQAGEDNPRVSRLAGVSGVDWPTGHSAQIAMARAACSRALATSAVSGNHSSGSRQVLAHRACRYTRPASSRSFGSPDRYRTGRSETVTATGCTSCHARFRSSLISARPARIPRPDG